jgi:tetratricopeptide (TPR) repeat protein
MSPSAATVTDFALELNRTDEDIAGLEASLGKAPKDLEKRTRLAYRLYHRATMTESIQAFQATEKAITATISQFGCQEDLCLLKANLDFRFHRLDEVARDLRMAPKLAGRFEARSLQADLAFQHGQYEGALAAYNNLIEEHRTWDNLARLAHFHGKMGDSNLADRLYAEAEDELTAKEMRSFAWLELQRGVLDIVHGRYNEAAAHYQRADRAYSGYWLVREHIAEVLAAMGRFAEAVAQYTQVIAEISKPELMQTLGELYVVMGDVQQATPWFERALAAYLESAERGEVHYFHHLTDFYTDVREESSAAVNWARKDLELRENFSTQAAMAWALYRGGEIDEALIWINRALSTGASDAELFRRAASIHKAAGQMDPSELFLASAATINAHYTNFHVHR